MLASQPSLMALQYSYPFGDGWEVSMQRIIKSVIAVVVIAILAIVVTGFALEAIWRKDADADSR